MRRLYHGVGLVVVGVVAMVAVIAPALAVGCAGGRTSAGSRIIVSAIGSIGALRVDQSGRTAVIALVGRPDAERRGQAVGGYRRYDALGYRCERKANEGTTPLVAGGPECRTVFYIDVRSGRLETFFTTDARYSEAHGVRIGTPTAVAERLLHKRLFEGCETDLYLYSASATLTIAFTGGVVKHPRKTLHVIGGHVYALVLHGQRRDAGVFDCL